MSIVLVSCDGTQREALLQSRGRMSWVYIGIIPGSSLLFILLFNCRSTWRRMPGTAATGAVAPASIIEQGSAEHF